MDREDFMDLVYSELASDPDNNRANRIIWAADGYAERRVNDALQVIKEQQSVKLGTNLAEVSTDTISRQAAIDALNEYFVRIGKLKRRGLNKGEKAISLDTVGAINSLPPAQPAELETLIKALEQEHKKLRGMQKALPEIIYCKDCRKHNKKVGFDENFHTVWKEDACPLVSWRGKAQEHEFDYQYCVFAERRTDERSD